MSTKPSTPQEYAERDQVDEMNKQVILVEDELLWIAKVISTLCEQPSGFEIHLGECHVPIFLDNGHLELAGYLQITDGGAGVQFAISGVDSPADPG